MEQLLAIEHKQCVGPHTACAGWPGGIGAAEAGIPCAILLHARDSLQRIDRQASKKDAVRHNGCWNGSLTGKQALSSDAATQTASSAVDKRAERHQRSAYYSGAHTSSGRPLLNGTTPRALREAFSNLDSTLRSGALIGGAMQSLSRESVELAGRALQKQIDARLKVVNSRTPEEFFVAQRDLLRTTVPQFTSSVRRMTEAISKIVE